MHRSRECGGRELLCRLDGQPVNEDGARRGWNSYFRLNWLPPSSVSGGEGDLSANCPGSRRAVGHHHELPLANGVQYVRYSSSLVASGGITPYTWALASGTLPAGLTLSSSGVISGTPTAAGTSVSPFR